ncbi:MAG: helix-hairpin-helix domain-containing protein [Pirellulaceae bacterium]|nr:helix-hairpin-helix domain-containing protein [Pirellulaceae bacterium]
MREPDTQQKDDQGRGRTGTHALREQPPNETPRTELSTEIPAEPSTEPQTKLLVEPPTDVVADPRAAELSEPPMEAHTETDETARLAVVQAGGWILTLAIVGLWIGASQFWQRTGSQPAIVEAEYKVDINQARERDLLNLPEVGPALAKSILAYRAQHGNFHSLSEFGEVPGVGPQTLKQLAPFLYFSDQPDGAKNETLEDTTDDTLLTAQRRERIAP